MAPCPGQPDLPPPDTFLVRLRGTVSPMEIANVMKTAINLSKERRVEHYAGPAVGVEGRGERPLGSDGTARDPEAGGGVGGGGCEWGVRDVSREVV